MNIVSKVQHKIFVKDYEGKELYSIGLSKKDMQGNYINGYMTCRFRKGEHIPNKANIIIKDAWLDFSVSNKKTYPYIFINEYELVNENIHADVKQGEYKTIKAVEQSEEEVVYNNAYEEMGKEVEIDPSELPF